MIVLFLHFLIILSIPLQLIFISFDDSYTTALYVGFSTFAVVHGCLAQFLLAQSASVSFILVPNDR